jgi:hypothetical protein
MSFSTKSAFAVDADTARQRIAAADLGQSMTKAKELAQVLNSVQSRIQSWADALSDITFEWHEEEPDWDAMHRRLEDMQRAMDSVLSSVRDTRSADNPSRTSRIGQDDMDSGDVSRVLPHQQ